MTGMLASVSSLDEALLVEQFNVDVIDLKQPAQGALGALDIQNVRQIVAELQSNTLISATVGDLPMSPDLVFEAVRAMAATGVDYVKIGFFPGGDWQGCIERLAAIAKDQALIAVLFADTRPDFVIIDNLAKAGFRGVMIDTMDKSLGSLTQLLQLDEVQRFVQIAKAQSLLIGLAGSLRINDISRLLPLGADYLGFRGALCHQNRRTDKLDRHQILAIRLSLAVTNQVVGSGSFQKINPHPKIDSN